MSTDLLAPFTQLTSTAPVWRQSVTDFWNNVGKRYLNQSIDAWNQNVPFECTNNPDIAYRYAKLVTHYILDCRHQGYQGKFVLLECGAGLGQFAYLFLQQLFKNLEQTKVPTACLHYIMCDQNEKTRHFWHHHPQLGSFFKSGAASSAGFSMQGNLDIHSDINPEHITTGRLILIANYFFDSLPQTPFQKVKGHYKPCTIKEKNPLFFKNKTTTLQFYPQVQAQAPFGWTPGYDTILEQHHECELTHLLMPDGPMKLIQWLTAHNNYPLLLLVTDKGFTDFTYERYGDHFDIINTGIYSSCVNFFALDSYIRNVHHGSSYLAPPDHVTLSSNIFLTDDRLENYPAFSLEAKHFTQIFSSKRRLHTLRLLGQSRSISSASALLMQLEESHYDPSLLHQLMDQADDCIKNDTLIKNMRLDDAITKLREHYYFTPHDLSQDQMVCIIHFALAGQRFSTAKVMIDQFGQWHGENYFFKRMQGTFYFLQSDFSSSAHYFLAALQDNPECTYSQHYLGHCEAIL